MSSPSAASGRAPSSSRRRRATRMSGQEREDAILVSLERLLARQPLHSISVDELARGAGISRPTFYFYFASKEAVLLTLLERLVEEAWVARADVPALLGDDPVGAWRLALGASFETWTRHRDVIRAAAEARTTHPGIQRLWADLLERFVAQTTEAIELERERGHAPAGVPARELALCLNRMNERIFETTLADGEATLEEDRVHEVLVDVWLRAIYGSPPDAATLDG